MRIPRKPSALAVWALGVCIACGGGDREGSPTADTIVSQATASDSGTVLTVRPSTETATTTTVLPAPEWAEPITILAADSVAGQRVYRRVAGCIACHGQNGQGVTGYGTSVADTVWHHGDGSLSFLYRVIRDGVADAAAVPMPASGQLPVRDLFQMAAYVYTLSHAGRTVADSSVLAAGAPPIARPPVDTTR